MAAIPKQLRTRIERAVDAALNFKGMSAGSPKVMLEISDVQYLLKTLDDMEDWKDKYDALDDATAWQEKL